MAANLGKRMFALQMSRLIAVFAAVGILIIPATAYTTYDTWTLYRSAPTVSGRVIERRDVRDDEGQLRYYEYGIRIEGSDSLLWRKLPGSALVRNDRALFPGEGASVDVLVNNKSFSRSQIKTSFGNSVRDDLQVMLIFIAGVALFFSVRPSLRRYALGH